MNPGSPTVAIVGATGALGRELLTLLEDRGFPVGRTRLYGSAASAGAEILLGNRLVKVESLPEAGPHPADLTFFVTSSRLPPGVVETTVARGGVVLEVRGPRVLASSRMVVPEINGDQVVLSHLHYVCPVAAAVPAALVVKALGGPGEVSQGVLTVLEPTSVEGQRGMETLSREVVRLYRQGEVSASDTPDEAEDQAEDDTPPSPFPHQVAFNAIPRVGEFLADGSTSGEDDIVRDIQQVLGEPIPLAVTCVRVPWFSCHALTLTLTLKGGVEVDVLRQRLSQMPGLEVVDEPGADEYPMPFTAIGRDEVLVGRVRLHRDMPGVVSVFVASDNFRKGTALNLVQLAEVWLSRLSEQ